MEEFLSNSPNLILRTGNDETVLYANQASEALLEFWNIRTGEKLPPKIGKIVRRVLFLKKAEKMELRAGKKVYSITLTSPEAGDYAVIYGSDITSFRETEEKLSMRDKQHEALSKLGEIALKAPELGALMNETVALVASTLEVEYCKILKLLPAGNFRFEAGIGWNAQHPGTLMEKETAIRAGYTLLSSKPVATEVTTEVTTEVVTEGVTQIATQNLNGKEKNGKEKNGKEKFREAKFCEYNQIASGMSALIGSEKKPFGLIAVHSRVKREFTKEEAYFLGSVAGLVAETFERKKMEETLRDKVNFLETLLDTIPAPVFFKDKKGVYRDCNWLFARSIIGLPREKVLGQSIEELLESIPGDLGSVYKLMDGQLMRKGGHQFYESKVMCSDGVKRDFMFNKTVYRDSSGSVEGLVGVMLDITGRKRTEENLQKSEERHRIIAEQTGQLLYEFDLKNGHVEWAGAIRELTGYAYKEIQALDFYDWLNHVHPGDRERVRKTFRKCWNSGEKFHTEYRFCRKDGSYFYGENKGVFLRDEEGCICRALGVIKDITEIKLASEKLKESEERYRKFLQNFRGIGFQGDMNFNALFMHGSLEEITGYREEDFCSGRLRWDQIIYPEDLPAILEDAEKLRKIPGAATEREYRIRKKDGNICWVLEIVLNISDESGKPVLVQGAIYDVTERKIAEEAVAKAEEIRKREIHHRIKNNLQVVSSLLSLQSDKFMDEEVVSAFRESENRVISMSLIHEELHKSEDFESIDFKAYLQKLTSDLFRSYRVGDKGIRLHLNVDDIFLGIDTAIPLGIITNELISNSLKYAFSDKNEGEIHLSLQKEPARKSEFPGNTALENAMIYDSNNPLENTPSLASYYALVFADNGTGLPEDLDFKCPKTLGLQLVNALVDQIDGKIEVESDAGTVFKISFPDLQ
ncbi:TPA: PAS domain S-box protein [Methanosarcinaceae archaeon]|nr:PAS domain S-box protein [Methanosarcinaceae archaeon]